MMVMLGISIIQNPKFLKEIYILSKTYN